MMWELVNEHGQSMYLHSSGEYLRGWRDGQIGLRPGAENWTVREVRR